VLLPIVTRLAPVLGTGLTLPCCLSFFHLGGRGFKLVIVVDYSEKKYFKKIKKKLN
jgi:hypothetical protein